MSLHALTADYVTRSGAAGDLTRLDNLLRYAADQSLDLLVLPLRSGMQSASGSTAYTAGTGSTPNFTLVGSPTRNSDGLLLNGTSQCIWADDFLGGAESIAVIQSVKHANITSSTVQVLFAQYRTGDNQRGVMLSWQSDIAGKPYRMFRSSNGTSFEQATSFSGLQSTDPRIVTAIWPEGGSAALRMASEGLNFEGVTGPVTTKFNSSAPVVFGAQPTTGLGFTGYFNGTILAGAILRGTFTTTQLKRVEELVELMQEPLVTFSSTSPETLRSQLINRIWSGSGLPTSGITSRTNGVTNPMDVTPTNLLRVDGFIVECRDNSNNVLDTVVGHLFIPKSTLDLNRLIIHGVGHTTDLSTASGGTSKLLVQELVNEGYAVALVWMPYGSDVTPHNALPTPTETLNHLRVFLEPMLRTINEFLPTYGQINCIGHSGGGWALALLQAIDTRIKRSIASAGSYPLGISVSGRDWEQFLPGISDLVDYHDLYLLSVTGNRKFIQTHNRSDSCCFTLPQYLSLPYRAHVKDRAEQLGGEYDLRFVVNSAHSMLPETRTFAMDFLSVVDSVQAYRRLPQSQVMIGAGTL